MDNWIVTDAEHLGGSPRVRGTRISITLILESFAAGMTIAQIVDAYPSLTEGIGARRPWRTGPAERSPTRVKILLDGNYRTQL